jgi:hypothetical protein
MNSLEHPGASPRHNARFSVTQGLFRPLLLRRRSRQGSTMKNAWMALAACGAALAMAPAARAGEPAQMPGPAFPEFKAAAQVRQACDNGLRGAATQLKTLEKEPSSATWIARYDAFYGWVEDIHGPIEFIRNVHPDQKVRDAAEACELRWQDFLSGVGQNPRLYQAAGNRRRPTTSTASRCASPWKASRIRRRLGPAQRARAKQLVNRIGELGQKFDMNVRDGTLRLSFTRDELRGVPEQVLRSARLGPKGRLLLGLDYPTYFPVMERAENPATREKMWRAKMNEGGPGNLKLLAEIARLRRDYAKLFGFDSYADFTLRRRMAKSIGNARAIPRRGQARGQRRRAARPRRVARCQGPPPGPASGQSHAAALGRGVLHRAPAQGALHRRRGVFPAVLPAAGEPALRDAHR